MRHEGRACGTRMNSVVGPVLRRGIFRSFIKHPLKWNERSVERIRDSPGCSSVLIELGKPLVVDCAATQDERFANNQPGPRQSFASALQQSAIIPFIYFDRAMVFAIECMPEIIHTDQNA